MSARQRAESKTDTAARILGVATDLMQQRGYHGFTFHDVAAVIGVSHVAVHYHFKTKAELVEAAMRAYTAAFVAELAAIMDRTDEPRDQLQAYIGLFESAATDGNRFCLCGALTAELSTLPNPVVPAVRAFFGENEAWLTRVLTKLHGRNRPTVRIRRMAGAFLAALEGAMLSARAHADPGRVLHTGTWLLESVNRA